MILSGKKIHEEIKAGRIEISPFSESRINPNSYNLQLGDEIGLYRESVLDPKRDNPFMVLKLPDEGFLLNPGVLYLCKTYESTYTDKYVPMIEGRSSLGRLGLYIHVTAGFGDVGFRGNWTLELMAIHKIWIYPRLEICQIYFHTIDGEYDLYDGKYNNAGEVQASRMYEEFKNACNPG